MIDPKMAGAGSWAAAVSMRLARVHSQILNRRYYRFVPPTGPTAALARAE